MQPKPPPQVFFSKHNPVFSRQLSWLMRWMYGSVILSYFSAFLSTPLLMLVPMITVSSLSALSVLSMEMHAGTVGRAWHLLRGCKGREG